MPAYPRKQIVADDEVGLYHCSNRCVRRAFLCGVDPLTGNDYDHRKDWIHQQLQHLASIFAIELCSYAVMSNHFHLIVRTRPDLVQGWSDEEVALRWSRLAPAKDIAPSEPVEPSQSDHKHDLIEPEVGPRAAGAAGEFVVVDGSSLGADCTQGQRRGQMYWSILGGEI